MAAITTILSDLGNVVVRFSNVPTFDVLRGLMRKPDGEGAVPLERILFDDRFGLWNHFDRGLIAPEDIIPTVLAAIGAGGEDPRGDLVHLAKCGWQDVFAFNRPVRDLWSRLRGAGMTLTAVSNIDAVRWEKLSDMGVEGLFDHLVLSYEERMVKQDGPEIFIRALDRSGCQAGEAFFVDDRPDCVQAAAALGIRTHVYDYRDHKALEKALVLAGVPLFADIPP